MAQGLTKEIVLPTPSAVGQVLTATGLSSDTYAWAAAVAAGTVKGVWSTTGTYAVGDVVAYLNGLYQASVASTNQATFPTASFTALTLPQFKGTWSTTGTYAIGDVVVYTNGLYRATAASTNQATFPTASFAVTLYGLPTAAPTAGQVLTANSATPGDVSWQTPASAGAAPGAWTNLTLNANFTAAVAANAPQYRVLADRVEFRGAAYPATPWTGANKQICDTAASVGAVRTSIQTGTWDSNSDLAVRFYAGPTLGSGKTVLAIAPSTTSGSDGVILDGYCYYTA